MAVAKAFAEVLSRQGLHAFLIHLPGYGQRKSNDAQFADDLIEIFMQGIADVRRARDAIAALPCVSSAHVSVQGTSLGGFVACLAASLDSSFDAVHLCLCGGDLHGVLTTGNRDAEKTLRKLLASGIRRDELPDKLRPIEPLRIAHRLDPSKTWLYSASFDQVVPAQHASQLATAIGLDPSHHIQLLATHYSGIIYLPGICERIAQVAKP
jgi:cephalosporin-C deacetylase-like acetyl esterase